MNTNRAERQRFSIGYHLNIWDLAGLPLRSALEFLAGQGVRWFEMRAGNSLSDHFARKYMALGDLPPPRAVMDTDILRRFALLSQAERAHGIRLASLHVNAAFVNPVAWPYERDVIEAIARLLKGLGAPVLVLGGGPAETCSRRHKTGDYKAFVRSLEDIGRRTHDFGIATVYHPHLDTFIERRDQLDRMMDMIDTDLVGLCIDPAHLAQANSDPVDTLRTYMHAVRYVHLHDTRIDPSLKGSDRYTAFCDLGAGAVDLGSLVDVLIEAEYDGLVTVDLAGLRKTAEESALESIAYLRDTLGLELQPANTKQAPT